MVFSAILLGHYRSKPQSYHVLWWLIGVLTYGAGTLTESLNTVVGWSETNFRWWYITGALLGGAPLAQGTVYLTVPKRWAHALTALLVAYVFVASVFVWLSPIDLSLVNEMRMSGSCFDWQWVRKFSPFVNLYAVAFLVGGALLSAYKYFKSQGSSTRFYGNLLIAVGAILPGIGGSFTRFGYVEVLYVTEFLGLACIWVAYRMMRNDSSESIHDVQR